jgi:hypothetical protein
VEGVPIDARQPNKQQRIASIIVRPVIRPGRISYEPFAFLTADPDDEGRWFRRGMSG